MNHKLFHEELLRGDRSEKGNVLIIFGFFILTMVPLLALSIDSYFMAQGRLEEQNLAEYAALTSLDGYVRKFEEFSGDHSGCKTQSLSFLKDMEGKNGVTGLASDSGWNFSSTGCTGSECSGQGWKLTYGTWNQLSSEFTPSINPTLINAVKFTMEIPDNGFVDFFRTSLTSSHNSNEGPSGQGMSAYGGDNDEGDEGDEDNEVDKIKLPVSAVAYYINNGASKFFRLTRIEASGTDSV